MQKEKIKSRREVVDEMEANGNDETGSTTTSAAEVAISKAMASIQVPMPSFFQKKLLLHRTKSAAVAVGCVQQHGGQVLQQQQQKEVRGNGDGEDANECEHGRLRGNGDHRRVETGKTGVISYQP
jgi:hypothetical protein